MVQPVFFIVGKVWYRWGGAWYGLIWIRGNNANKKSEIRIPWHHTTIVCCQHGGDSAFVNIEDCFKYITQTRPERRYYPKPTKSIFIFYLDNLEAGICFSAHHGFKVWTGAHYLGGFIEDDPSKQEWIIGHTEFWEKNICTIRKTLVKYSQESYAAITRVIKSY